MCVEPGDSCIGFNFVRWLFGCSMLGLLVDLFVPLLSFLAMPGLCGFLRAT